MCSNSYPHLDEPHGASLDSTVMHHETTPSAPIFSCLTSNPCFARRATIYRVPLLPHPVINILRFSGTLTSLFIRAPVPRTVFYHSHPSRLERARDWGTLDFALIFSIVTTPQIKQLNRHDLRPIRAHAHSPRAPDPFQQINSRTKHTPLLLTVFWTRIPSHYHFPGHIGGKIALISHTSFRFTQ